MNLDILGFMTAYESRIRAWAKNRGMKDCLTAKIDEVEHFMRSAGHIEEFYEAFPDYDPTCELKVSINIERKMVLECLAKISNISKGYDRVEGYLGESFCEDQLRMRKTRGGTKDIDGYVQGRSVQVKFKWVNAQNLGSRYVTVRPDSQFDLLIVTCADYGDSEISLFGIWDKTEVLKVMSSDDRVYLTKLRSRPESTAPIPQVAPELIFK